MTSAATASNEMLALSEYLDSMRLQVEDALRAYLPQIDKLSEACPTRLALAMRYSALAGGKRLRPILSVMAAEACGGDRDSALPAACASKWYTPTR